MALDAWNVPFKAERHLPNVFLDPFESPSPSFGKVSAGEGCIRALLLAHSESKCVCVCLCMCKVGDSNQPEEVSV